MLMWASAPPKSANFLETDMFFRLRLRLRLRPRSGDDSDSDFERPGFLAVEELFHIKQAEEECCGECLV